MQKDISPSLPQPTAPVGPAHPSPRSLPLIQVLFGSSHSPMKTSEGQVSKDLETTSDLPHSLHVEAPSGAGNVCMSPTTPYQKAAAVNSSAFEDVKAEDTCDNVHHTGDGGKMECLQGAILHHLLSLSIFCACTRTQGIPHNCTAVEKQVTQVNGLQQKLQGRKRTCLGQSEDRPACLGAVSDPLMIKAAHTNTTPAKTHSNQIVFQTKWGQWLRW